VEQPLRKIWWVMRIRPLHSLVCIPMRYSSRSLVIAMHGGPRASVWWLTPVLTRCFLVRRVAALLVVLVSTLSATRAFAATECSATSGPATVALIELYTSEGCDSCPPADRWLAEMARRGFGPDKAVGLSLHVDYWDQLGWKDPFARAAFSVRQREQVRLGGGTVSYTPQIMLNGRDYRRWSTASGFVSDIAAINARPSRATISLTLRPGGQATAEITASAAVKDSVAQRHAALFVALYEDGLFTNVTAGENKGVTLRHDRVVREWFGPLALEGGRIDLRRAIMLPARSKVSGAVGFVQDRKSGEVLQALGVAAC
jgi:hypothetical protein